MSVIRELRVIDIRCQAKGCGAGPGQRCNINRFTEDSRTYAHPARHDEHEALVAAGWEWQEVNPTDIGASRKP